MVLFDNLLLARFESAYSLLACLESAYSLNMGAKDFGKCSAVLL